MTAPIYLLRGQRFTQSDTGFRAAVEAAYAEHRRPLCLCRPDGVPMYVARMGATFVLKRMPCTGGHHTPACHSHESPERMLDGGRHAPAAITKDVGRGTTSLKLGFRMSRSDAEAADSRRHTPVGESTGSSPRLTMQDLLHYLWEQAELNRWQPGFAGRRSWATVRRHLVAAAEGKFVGERALRDWLYIPEVFSAERREEIRARRKAHWANVPHAAGRMMLLIGEVKKIVSAQHNFKLVLKHVPDQAFTISRELEQATRQRFGAELSLRAELDESHLIAIGTFSAGPRSEPSIDALALMPTCAEWIPVANAFEHQLVDRLLQEGRRFIKPPCCRSNSTDSTPVALLLDTEQSPAPLRIARPPTNSSHSPMSLAGETTVDWNWCTGRQAMPPLPRAARHRFNRAGQTGKRGTACESWRPSAIAEACPILSSQEVVSAERRLCSGSSRSDPMPLVTNYDNTCHSKPFDD